MFKLIKDTLLEDSSLILDILEDLDCHDMLENDKEIRCALPEKNNNTSVRIKKTYYLSVDIFSEHDFEDFETAVTSKIGREVVGVPAPGALILLGLGLFGFSVSRKSKALHN